jgi:hypothetical protein
MVTYDREQLKLVISDTIVYSLCLICLVRETNGNIFKKKSMQENITIDK